jgi:hypothetical protein
VELLGRDSIVEHATQGDTIDITSMYAKADDAPRWICQEWLGGCCVNGNYRGRRKVDAWSCLNEGRTPYKESVYLNALKHRGSPLLNPSTTVKMT